MDSLQVGKKGVPVTILGLENAGKTTLVERLKTGEFKADTTPTMGVSFETFTVGDTLFKIFDVGGQFFFRQQFWVNYASNSYGVVFVFDASDKERTAEGKEWFWYLIENLKVEKRIVVAFLANKVDLECMSLDEIIETLELPKLGEYPEISFQIFRTSNKTGDGIDQAMDWFTKKLKDIAKDKIVHPKGLIVSTTLGRVQLFLDFDEMSKRIGEVKDLLAEIFRDEARTLREEKLSTLTNNDLKLVCQEKSDVIITMITDPQDSHVEAQRYIDQIYTYLEARSAKTKDELVNFIVDILQIPEDRRDAVRTVKV
ncbi:MAG: ADP-ribosylation factor family protein [Candidatus Heimdallarchaeaceae archaeon]